MSSLNPIAYWNTYYNNKKPFTQPSLFAIYCASHKWCQQGFILDAGCGDGRDAAFFADTHDAANIIACDLSPIAIQHVALRKCSNILPCIYDVTHQQSLLPIFTHRINIIYSRFFLHTLTRQGVQQTLQSFLTIQPTYICLEFRSALDKNLQQSCGQLIHQQEGIYCNTHLRRPLHTVEVTATLNELYTCILNDISDQFAPPDKNLITRLIFKHK